MISNTQKNTKEIAVFGGGCFWCTEAVFKMLKGIESVKPGYAGGTTANPTYEEVCNGKTGHAEVIQIVFDPEIISYRELLTVFFGSHDPSTKNRQGNDVGPQYRSIILFTTPGQKVTAEEYIQEINDSNPKGANIVTEVVPLHIFYPAEFYHEDYYARNKRQPYCEIIINPKLEKVQRHFADLLNDEAKFK